LTIRVPGESDASLAARCRTGDEAAWRELVDRFSRYVYAIAVQGYRLGPDDAEDVFQEVFARAYERLGTLRSDEALRPWLAQLTRRCCVDRLRRRAREQPAEEIDEAADEEAITRVDEALVVHEALARLSPECAEVLDRFFARDESYRTIGTELGLPSGTIASRISRCLGHLRKEYEGRNPTRAPSRERVTR
jgi:RNA polymerase sigma-70 factor (ECF subfamily)